MIQSTKAYQHDGLIVITFDEGGLSAGPNPNGPGLLISAPGDTSGEVTVTGTVTAAGVIGPTAQYITAGDFAGVVDTLASSGTIHTKQFPAGGIRRQVHAEGRHREGDDGKDNDPGNR